MTRPIRIFGFAGSLRPKNKAKDRRATGQSDCMDKETSGDP